MKYLLILLLFLPLTLPAQTVLFAQRINVNQLSTPTTGGTVTIANSAAPNIHLIVTPAGALLALTVNLPSSPIDGQTVTIVSSQAVTTLTLGGGTIVSTITTLAANAFARYVYNAGDSKWYRIT